MSVSKAVGFSVLMTLMFINHHVSRKKVRQSSHIFGCHFQERMRRRYEIEANNNNETTENDYCCDTKLADGFGLKDGYIGS